MSKSIVEMFEPNQSLFSTIKNTDQWKTLPLKGKSVQEIIRKQTEFNEWSNTQYEKAKQRLDAMKSFVDDVYVCFRILQS
jgi:hypothetical protein